MAILIRLIIIAATLMFYAAAALRFRLKIPQKAIGGSAINESAQIRLSNGLAAAAWILNYIVVIVNWIVNGYVPFAGMYQVLTFLSAIMLPVYLYMAKVKGDKDLIMYFLFASAIVLTGVDFMNQRIKWHFPPSLQSVFFVPHVLSYMLSYSLCAVAAILTVVMLVEKDKGKKIEIEKRIYDLTLLAFPFMSLGMVLGAIWANECWGNYWSWDPKETWALVTWWLYALYFHTRKIKQFRKFTPAILIAAFVALVITFVGVGLITGGSVHSYV